MITRGWIGFGFVLGWGALSGWPVRAQVIVQPPSEARAIVGGWTLDKNLSDRAPDPNARGNPDDGDRGGGRRGGGRGGGGFGGGGRAGGFGAGAPAGRANAEDAARIRDAMRDLTNPPEHLVIVDAGSMVVLTGPDGRTLRLSPDGKKIKDENTGIERKTAWLGGRLVSEINGLGPVKITQTYAADPERHQLKIVDEFDPGGRQARTLTFVYRPDER